MKSESAHYLRLPVISLALFILIGCGALGPDKKTSQNPPEPIEIAIGHPRDVLQGYPCNVAISIDADLSRFSWFDLLLTYDPNILTFEEALPGRKLVDNEWEYFSHHQYVDSQFHDLAFVNLIGIADIDPLDQNIIPGNGDPEAITHLVFQVSDNRQYECLFVPVRFFWGNCEDNIFFSLRGDTVGLSRSVYDTSHTDTGQGYLPQWLGAPDSCLQSLKQMPVAMIDFINGGIDIVCSDSIVSNCGPGDLTGDGICCEVADAMFYSIILTNGLTSFDSSFAACIMDASDVNYDKIAPTVADFQYLVRIITGDVIFPWDNLDIYSMQIDIGAGADEMIVSYTSGEDIGAVLMTFRVDEIPCQPLLGSAANHMGIRYSQKEDTIKVLIYDIGTQFIPAGAGELLTIPSESSPVLLYTEAAGYYGNLMEITISP